MGQAIDRMLSERAPTVEQEVAEATETRQAETLLDVLAPVLNFEKTDIEFWVQIAQLVVLLLLLRRLS